MIAQSPAPSTRVERADLDVVLRVSRGTALATVPEVEGSSRSDATAALRRVPASPSSARSEESWETPEGRVISSDVAAGDEARRPGPIGIVVSSGPPRASVPDVRGVAVDDAAARLDGSFDTAVVEEGSDTEAAGTVLRQYPAPGSRAVLGSKVTLTVARAPEWGTTWSQSGSGSYDSATIEVTAAQGKWRIVVELHPRYLIFGSGSATFVVGGHGAPGTSARLGRLGRGRAAQRRRLVPRCTCTRTAASPGPCASSSSGSQRSTTLGGWTDLRLLWCVSGS